MAIIGIDLGTTNSVAAVARLGQEGRVLPAYDSGGLVPSAVAIRGGKWIVGREALELDQVVVSIKRLIGRAYDEEVPLPGRRARRILLRDLVRNRWGYEVVPVEGGRGIKVKVGGSAYTPIELSAHILRTVAGIAKQRLREPIDGAVVTVPAYFEDRQKNATREAIAKAGLPILGILNEPAATALVYARRALSINPKTVVVYDLGGGTFDVTVGEIEGPNYMPLEVGGSNLLGGDDFDDLIFSYVNSELPSHVSRLIEDEPWRQSKLRTRIRQAKELLSEAEEADVLLGDFLDGAPPQMKVRRSQFEAWIAPFVQETVELTKYSLKASGRDIQEVDTVLLAGGSTRVPCVREALEDLFGAHRIQNSVDVMHAVAIGAAEFAQRLNPNVVHCPRHGHENKSENESCGTCGDTLPTAEGVSITERPYGLQVRDETGVAIADWGIPKGEFLSDLVPAKHTYHVPKARFFKMRFLQGVQDETGEYPREAKYHSQQAVLWMKLPPGEHDLTVKYSLSEEGLCNVEVLCDVNPLGSFGILRASDEWGSTLEGVVDRIEADLQERQSVLSTCKECGTHVAHFEELLERAGHLFTMKAIDQRRVDAADIISKLNKLAAEIGEHEHQQDISSTVKDAHSQETSLVMRLHNEWRDYFVHCPARDGWPCPKCSHEIAPSDTPASDCPNCGQPVEHDLWHENERLLAAMHTSEESESEDILADLRGRVVQDRQVSFMRKMELAAWALTNGLEVSKSKRIPQEQQQLVAELWMKREVPMAEAQKDDPWPWFRVILKDCEVNRSYCEKLGLEGLRYKGNGEIASPTDIPRLGDLLPPAYENVKMRLLAGDIDGAERIYKQYWPLIMAGMQLLGR